MTGAEWGSSLSAPGGEGRGWWTTLTVFGRIVSGKADTKPKGLLQGKDVTLDAGLVEAKDLAEEALEHRRRGAAGGSSGDLILRRVAQCFEDVGDVVGCPLIVLFIAMVRGEIVLDDTQLEDGNCSHLVTPLGAVTDVAQLIDKGFVIVTGNLLCAVKNANGLFLLEHLEQGLEKNNGEEESPSQACRKLAGVVGGFFRRRGHFVCNSQRRCERRTWDWIWSKKGQQTTKHCQMRWKWQCLNVDPVSSPLPPFSPLVTRTADAIFWLDSSSHQTIQHARSFVFGIRRQSMSFQLSPHRATFELHSLPAGRPRSKQKTTHSVGMPTQALILQLTAKQGSHRFLGFRSFMPILSAPK